MLETEHTQNDKGRANQRKHGDKIDILKSDESFTRLAITEICCTGHSCIGAIVKIGMNAVATRKASGCEKPFSKS